MNFYKYSSFFKGWNRILYAVSIETGKIIYLEENFLFVAKLDFLFVRNKTKEITVKMDSTSIKMDREIEITNEEIFDIRNEWLDNLNFRNFVIDFEDNLFNGINIIKKGVYS
jgi:hypothetical protein